MTATPGITQVDLSWTKPSDGGRVIDTYIIQWRPVGTTSFTGATATFGTNTNPPATQTTITGLTNGTEYEFFVTATAPMASSVRRAPPRPRHLHPAI